MRITRLPLRSAVARALSSMAAGACATDAKVAARQETKIAASARRERFNISQFPLWVKKRPKGHEGLIGYHPRAGLDVIFSRPCGTLNPCRERIAFFELALVPVW